jgi:nucleoside-diphosphate-sugar epimerase
MIARFDSPSRAVILTGASGFIGRALLERLREKYHVYALARRSQDQAGITPHRNIDWISVDIVDAARLQQVFERIRSEGPVDFVLHLAGYYSFENAEEPEYELTNVQGTRNVLECSRCLDLARFVFASSLVVSKFPPPGGCVTEETPPDADFPYARSKRKGEKLMDEYSEHFPCSVVRLAATFSDWCEYGPFYMLLMNWLGKRWNSRIIAGRGETAQPFIHIEYVVQFLLSLLDSSSALPRFGTYTVSSDEIYSHRELFEVATRLKYGESTQPILVPRPLATIGLVARDIFGRLIRRRPFERLWMMKYVDRQIRADTSFTKEQIPVAFKPRLSLRRRFPYMLENMLGNPSEWRRRNIATLEHKSAPPNMVIAEIMRRRKKEFLKDILQALLAPARHLQLPHYQALGRETLHRDVEIIFDLLVSCVQHRDRIPLLSFAHQLAKMRQQQGFPCEEVQTGLMLACETLLHRLRAAVDTRAPDQVLVDSLRLTMEMVVDEIEATFEAEAHTQALEGADRAGLDDEWPVMKNRDFLQSVIDSIDDSILIIDLAFRVRLMNRHAHQTHIGPGSTPDPLYCFQMTHDRECPCSGEDHPCPLEEVLRTGAPARTSHVHRDRHGRDFKVAILASPLLDENQEIVGIIESTYQLPS